VAGDAARRGRRRAAGAGALLHCRGEWQQQPWPVWQAPAAPCGATAWLHVRLASPAAARVAELCWRVHLQAAARARDVALIKQEGCKDAARLNFPLPQYKQVRGGAPGGTVAAALPWLARRGWRRATPSSALAPDALS
jgi:hypothetical protein